MRIVIRHLLLLLSLCMASPAFSADEPDPEPPEFDVEIIVVRNDSPDNTELRPPAVEIVEAEDGDLAEQAPRPTLRRYPPLQSSERRLTEIKQRLQRSAGWSPILHYAWRQPGEPREEAGAMSIAGNRLGTSVAGTVRLSLDRFLRLEIDLELDPNTGELYEMDQGRRLRSGQVHYFDHPQFGVIALVNRAPEDTALP